MKHGIRAFAGASLSTKLALLLVGTTALTLLLAAAAFGHYETTQARGALIRELVSVMGVVGANSTAALSFHDESAAAENLAPLGSDPRMLSAALFSREGVTVASWSRAGRRPTRFACATEPRFGPGSVSVCQPVFYQGRKVGFISAEVDTHQLSVRLWRAGAIAAVFVFAALGILIPVAIRVLRWVFRPLRELEKVAAAVATEKRYDLRASRQEDDEVGHLIGCFNHMMEQIERRDAELLRHRGQLEAEVDRRTAELVQAKERAETAARVKSDFLANMSHEIRTPITGVIGAIELALESQLTADQRELLVMAGGSARSLLAVINDILDFSKIEAGKLDLSCIPFVLEEVFSRTLGAVALVAHRKGLELFADIPDNVPAVLVGDPDRLQQVLLNLVGNAVKFTASGEVELSVTAMERSGLDVILRFQIRDTGIGIPKEQQQAIFESFTQADGSISRHFGGTGLGLTISRRLARLMNGKLEVESEPGAGSRFYLTGQFGLEPELSEREQRTQFAGERALIVAARASLTANLVRTVKQLGLLPALADSAEAVRAALQEESNPIRMALVDCEHELVSDGGALAAFEDAGFDGPALLLSPAHKILESEKIARRLVRGQVCPLPVLPGSLGALLARLRDPRRESEEGPASPAPRRRRLHVLLAEDNPVNRHIVTARLNKWGHRVEAAGTGTHALAAMERETFDVVLMDVQMPEMDGLTATRTQRQREAGTGRHQWILGLTANALAGDDSRCYNAGMDDYLTKPVDFSELERRLQALPERTAEDNRIPR